MPVLDRQAVVPAAPAAPPQRVPEIAPTPLQAHYVNLSAIALVAGAVAITALELGATISTPIVRLGILIAAPILIVTTADATLRIWRSAWVWMPVDRGRGLFRLAWVAVACLGIVAFAGAGLLAIRG